jgi:hypothetical protein
VIAAQLLFEARNLGSVPVAAGIFGAYTVIYLAYQLLSLPVQHAGPGFDLAAHQALVRSWRPARLPSVDILLPVCGEPAEVLRNAWAGVLQLIAAYPGEARGHVLDDGPDPDLMPMAAGATPSGGSGGGSRPGTAAWPPRGSRSPCGARWRPALARSRSWRLPGPGT